MLSLHSFVFFSHHGDLCRHRHRIVNTFHKPATVSTGTFCVSIEARPTQRSYSDIVSKDGKTVQYFQRARFERSANSVTLTPLGRETYTPEKQLVINNPLACQVFSETGYSVCFAFLEFFQQNGGVAQFGYPISPFEFRNNQIVQYFENARFEWRPGLAEGQRIGLTDLGRIYFDQLKEDPAFLKPSVQGVSGPNLVLDIQVRAFPKKAVTTPSDQQTIYVLVQDQNLQPVAGANGIATIRSCPRYHRFPRGQWHCYHSLAQWRGLFTKLSGQ